jgi:hypothetical protein
MPDPGTPGGRSKDSPEESFARPPEGTRVGQSRPGPVEKDESGTDSVAIEETGAKPGPDNRIPEFNLRNDY